MEAEPNEGSCGWACAECSYYVPVRTSPQNAAELERSTPGQGERSELADGRGVAISDLVALSVSGGPQVQCDLVAMLKTMLPLLGTPYMVNRFHANGGSQGDVVESDRFPVGDIQPYTEMPGSMADPRATSRPDCPATGGHPAETRLPEASTGGGCSTTTLVRIRRLRLLNSHVTLTR